MVTQCYVAKNGDAMLLLMQNDQIRTLRLDTRSQWRIGRHVGNIPGGPDIPLVSNIVSREHGRLINMGEAWIYADSPANTNGTYYNGIKIPKRADGSKAPVVLKNGDVLRIDQTGSGQSGPDGVTMMFVLIPQQGEWTTFPLPRQKETVIGRDEGCDIVEQAPYVSAKHAMIRYTDGVYYLSDCGSKAGTYLNGCRITSAVALRERDCISFCDCSYFFLGHKLLYAKRNRAQEIQELTRKDPQERPVILKADIDTKQVKNINGSGMKELIRDIHLEICQGTLVALLGTAGAGKSTVMNCLNGMDLEGVKGTVVYRNVDLMHNFDQMKYLIGSVPQEKTFHPDFTPEQEFRIAAQKRLPADTTKEEIEERVNRTIEILGICGVRKNRNKKLSGGEQTRVNIGIELVADRDLLCLDEPDQGLDPKYKHEVFQIMQDLAHKNGKSVMSIIHDVSEIDMFDQVIMLVKADGVGRLAFSGTPVEMRRKFGVEDVREVYGILEKDPGKYVI